MIKPAEAVNLDSRTLLDLDLDGVKLIEASAGTGKTHTIADLYLRQVLAGRQVSEILIVTYTNAATEELRGRIRKRLYDCMNCLVNDSPAGDAFLECLLEQWYSFDAETRAIHEKRLQLALRSMDEAAISTIHSFCQRSLQDHALSGNQFFDNELLANDDVLWDAAVKDWWRSRTYGLDDDAWRLVRDNLPGIDGLKAILLELRNRPLANLLPQAAMNLSDAIAQPRILAQSLQQLAPLWQKQRLEIIDIISHSKDLSRSNKLPYLPENLDSFFNAADEFFARTDPMAPFDRFEYMGADWLRQHSKNSMRGKDSRLQHEFFEAVNPIAKAWAEFKAGIKPLLLTDSFAWVSQSVSRAKREIPALAFQDQLGMLLEALESGNSGNLLARRLRRQYPVAMIDEFQDTDSIQYRIFRRIYPPAAAASLTLIGDPKQAIYSFRGGDIFTYMQARNLPQIQIFNLQTNWRSQPDLVKAINTVFSRRRDAFVYGESIDFIPATPIPENKRHQLLLQNRVATALTLWQLPQTEQGDNYNRDRMRELINQAIVGEIGALLGGYDARIDGRPVQSGDIAILVRTASEGQALSQVLHRHGIRTVTIGRDSVFSSDEALGLYDLLQAIANFQDPLNAHRSLASALLGLDYRQIAAIVDNDDAWQRWIEDLSELRQRWERQGFISMFQTLLHRFEITRHLAQQDNNERRITNLLHLSELLHQQSVSIGGMAPLLGWFNDQFDEVSSEEVELRLESDAALVKIVTIHKSKGLQYPIVFVPFMWSCKPVDSKRAIYFHDASLAPCIDLGSDKASRNWYLADKERLAEDIRLLYVALTRAHSKVYLAWGQAGSPRGSGYARQTALAYLLHSSQSPHDLDHGIADGFPANMDLGLDLQRLVDGSDGSIELVELPRKVRTGYTSDGNDAQRPENLAIFTRSGLPRWRVNSFTGLTRGIHQPAQLGTELSQGDAVLDFPAGSHIGLMLHSLLENLDFQRGVEAQCRQLFPLFLPRSGISGESERKTLMNWLADIVQTPLDGDGLALNKLSRARRLNELAFDFALDHFDDDALNRFFQSLTPTPIKPVGSTGFSGLITGVIDLVFEFRGRYYLADYKSNYLGASLDDYLPARLEQAMLERRYDLQSLIYSVALHRYLSCRLPDYDYESHFGGSYYLFLRAMRPQHGNRYGIYFHRPELNLLQTLETLLDFTPAESVSA